MGFIYFHVVGASFGRLVCGTMDAERRRAGEHKVAQDIFPDGKKGGDEVEVELGWLLDPGQLPVRWKFEELDTSREENYGHHCRP